MKKLSSQLLIALSIAISLILLSSTAQAEELKASEMPEMGKELKKLNKACGSVTNNFRKGKDTTKDIQKAIQAYDAVIAKTPEETVAANYHMADMYYNMKSWDDCFKWLKKAEASLTENDHFYGQGTHNKLGWAYYFGRGCEKNEKLAVDHFWKEFEFDPIKGNWDYALVYLLGINNQKSDCIMALNHLKLATNVMLRWPYIYAIEYYLENIENISDATWQNFLTGFKLFTVDSSVDEAIPYLEKAINDGFLPANVLLADLYLGKGNVTKSIEIIIPASDKGYAPALHQHGHYIELSIFGKLFQWDQMAKLSSLFINAANLGYPPSQNTAGYLYLNGYGKAVDKDPREAYKWFETAILSGEPSASKGRDLAAGAIKKEAFRQIADELQNIGNKVESIIRTYSSKPEVVSSSIENINVNTAAATSSGIDKSEINRHENYYKKYVSYGEAAINRYNNAVADKTTCDAKNDWVGFRRAQDSMRKAEEDMERILNSMEHHRKQAERAGGNIEISKVEQTLRDLI